MRERQINDRENYREFVKINGSEKFASKELASNYAAIRLAYMNHEVLDTTLLQTDALPDNNEEIFHRYNMELIIKRLYSKVPRDQEASWKGLPSVRQLRPRKGKWPSER